MNLQVEMHAPGGLRRVLYALAFVCAPIPAIGAGPSEPLIACTELTEDATRLACFDREVAEIRKHSAQTQTRAAPTAEEQFGLSDKKVLGLEARPDQTPTPRMLRARIVSISRTATDRQVFVVDSAQTWQQIELDPDFAARIGQEVTISKGALGSFWLATDSHHATRVTRVR
jgi:hypothetical protein